MPKIIKYAQENILREAKALIVAEIPSALNMRTVAERVGVASGTLYNYFKSKEELVTSILLNDWITAFDELKTRLPQVESAIDGCEAIFNTIKEFLEQHRPMWQGKSHKDFIRIRLRHHKMLIEQLCEHIQVLGERFGFLFDETVAPFLAEVLLAGGSYPNSKFFFLAPCLGKIVARDE